MKKVYWKKTFNLINANFLGNFGFERNPEKINELISLMSD